jgi:hypothetical protein
LDLYVNEPEVAGFDLQPSVIPIWDPQPQGPSLDPGLARIRPTAALNEEGGLIEIETVLTSMDSPAEPRLGDVATDPPEESDSDKPDESFPLAANTPFPGSMIASELARATAFELAGGEPADDGRVTRAQQDEAPTTQGQSPSTPREPLSAVETNRNADRSVSASAPSQVDAVAVQMASAAGPLGGYVSDLQLTAWPAAEPAAGRLRGSATAPRGRQLDGASAFDAAHTAVYEELKENRIDGRSSLGWEFSLHGALNATPLLMILALERIAASNSRRASCDERSPVSLPLRRAK